MAPRALAGKGRVATPARVGAEDAPLRAARLALKPEIDSGGMGWRSIEAAEQLIKLPDFRGDMRTWMATRQPPAVLRHVVAAQADQRAAAAADRE